MSRKFLRRKWIRRATQRRLWRSWKWITVVGSPGSIPPVDFIYVFAVYLAFALVRLGLSAQITVLCFQFYDTTGHVLGRLSSGSTVSKMGVFGKIKAFLYTNIPILGFHGRADYRAADRRNCVERAWCRRHIGRCNSAIRLKCLIQGVGKEIIWWWSISVIKKRVNIGGSL
ncbi:hypothetical protein L210DRAFT_940483 [Boletus edulis BED1]|uniref:Uncharacterized protein n=1 Tax=Boletus edulis BED1 TaxID=1328754 RepID=A0AAD4C3T0_BOLED|nr:hypothetical protein L210DRAFT_940483 [Boletus edulis BED1]